MREYRRKDKRQQPKKTEGEKNLISRAVTHREALDVIVSDEKGMKLINDLMMFGHFNKNEFDLSDFQKGQRSLASFISIGLSGSARKAIYKSLRG